MFLHLAVSQFDDDRDSVPPAGAAAPVGRRSEDFDALLRRALQVLDAPLGLVAIVEGGHLRLVAEVGYIHVPRLHAHAMCREMANADTSLLVSHDAAIDPRFRDDPAICTHGVRFVCGVALFDPDGVRRGVAIAADTRPRAFVTPDQRAALHGLSRMTPRMSGERVHG